MHGVSGSSDKGLCCLDSDGGVSASPSDNEAAPLFISIPLSPPPLLIRIPFLSIVGPMFSVCTLNGSINDERSSVDNEFFLEFTGDIRLLAPEYCIASANVFRKVADGGGVEDRGSEADGGGV